MRTSVTRMAKQVSFSSYYSGLDESAKSRYKENLEKHGYAWRH